MSDKKLIAVVVAALVVMCAVLTGLYVKYDNSTEKMTVDLYFLNREGTGIMSEPCKIRYRNESELIRNTLEKLRRGPSSRKYDAIMPHNTQIHAIELLGDGFLTVDFSEEFLTEDSARNVLKTYAVVKTLCSTGVVSSVRVLANGASIKDRDGKPLEFISATDINLETEEYRSEMREVTLYFADDTKKKLDREVRTIKITDQQPIEQYIINELIKGTKVKKMSSVLSHKTMLVSVDVEENICYLNFKSGFVSENAGGADHEKLVIYSIVNSLTELENIGRVQFYMDGKRIDKFGDIDIKDYIERNTSIIKDQGEDEK